MTTYSLHRPRVIALGIVAMLLVATSAWAQMDFSGGWAPLPYEDFPEKLHGPEPGDYMGIPINDAGRLRGDSYDGGRIALLEYQCRPHGADFQMRGPFRIRIDAVLDPTTQQLIAWHMRTPFRELERTIWMDGRAHPDEMALHTWEGFSTGTWQDNMLNVYTTHLKSSYLRRNNTPRSSQATFTEHWMRHGNYLTVVTTTFDPVFLTEPLVRSQSWVLDPGMRMGRDICEYGEEIVRERKDQVPHALPGSNLDVLHEAADLYGLPYEIVRGGSPVLYPEYRTKMPKPEKPKEICGHYCDCNSGFNMACTETRRTEAGR